MEENDLNNFAGSTPQSAQPRCNSMGMNAAPNELSHVDRLDAEPTSAANDDVVQRRSAPEEPRYKKCRTAQPRRRYALATEIARAVTAVRAAGIPVSSVDLCQDGTIRLSSGSPERLAGGSAFDTWNEAGKL